METKTNYHMEKPFSVIYIRTSGFINTGGGVFATETDAKKETDRRVASEELDSDVQSVIIFDRREPYGVVSFGKIVPPVSVVAKVDWR